MCKSGGAQRIHLIDYSKGSKIMLDNDQIGKIIYRTEPKNIIDYIIISKQHRGKGYSKDALSLLLDKMNRPIETTNIKKSNMASRKLFKSLGFAEIKSGNQIIAVLR